MTRSDRLRTRPTSIEDKTPLHALKAFESLEVGQFAVVVVVRCSCLFGPRCDWTLGLTKLAEMDHGVARARERKSTGNDLRAHKVATHATG